MRRLYTVALALVAAGVLACTATPGPTPPVGTAGPTASATGETGAPAQPTASPAPSPTRPQGPTEGRTPEQISSSVFDDIALAVDRAGRAHAAVSRDGEAMHYLTDTGAGWVAEQIVFAPAGGADRSVQLGVDDDGTVHVVWVRWSAWNPCTFECPPEPSQVDGLYHVSGAAGRGWSEPSRLPFDLALEEGIDGLDIAVAAGQVHLTVRRWTDDSDSVWYGRGDGTEWRFEQAVADGWGARLAVTADGRPVIAFTYGHEAGYGIGLAERAAGTAFSSQAVPGSDGGLWPHLGLDEHGRPHIVFSHDDGTSYYVALVEGGWSEPALVARHAVSDAAPDSRADLHLIYDVGDGDPREGLWYSTNRPGDFEATQVDRRVRSVEDGPGAPSVLAVDDAGRAHVLYVVRHADLGNGLWYAIVPGFSSD